MQAKKGAKMYCVLQAWVLTKVICSVTYWHAPFVSDPALTVKPRVSVFQGTAQILALKRGYHFASVLFRTQTLAHSCLSPWEN